VSYGGGPAARRNSLILSELRVKQKAKKKKQKKHKKVLAFLANPCYNPAMENVKNTTAAAARPSTSDAEFEAQFGSEANLQDWLDWQASCLEADMSDPFLDDAH